PQRKHEPTQRRVHLPGLANDDLILGRRFEHHPFRRLSRGCFELAVLVTRLRTADVTEVTRCLDLIDTVVRDSLATPGTGPIDCSKCLLKLLLFAAKIAHRAFPHRGHSYLFEAKRLVPERPMGWTFADIQGEVNWYIKGVSAQARSTGNARRATVSPALSDNEK